MEQEYTIRIFTENEAGLLNLITLIFTRKKVNIESLAASESHLEGIHCYTMVTCTTPKIIRLLINQIKKLIGVVNAFYYNQNDIVYQEIALYKVPNKAISEGMLVENVLRENNAKIISVESGYMVIEKRGHKEETQELLEKLRPFGIIEFTRSGRVAVTREHSMKYSLPHKYSLNNGKVSWQK